MILRRKLLPRLVLLAAVAVAAWRAELSFVGYRAVPTQGIGAERRVFVGFQLRAPAGERSGAASAARAVEADTGSGIESSRSSWQTCVNFVRKRFYGIALVGALALVSRQIASLQFFGGRISPLLYSTLTGLLVGNSVLAKGSSLGSKWRPSLKPGVAYAKARLLRLGIILYGFKVSVQQILMLGPGSIVSALWMVFSTLMVGELVGVKLLKLDKPLAFLVTTGASICGVSAVMAAAPVVEEGGADGSKVSVALGTVMLFGIASMFLYPLLGSTVLAGLPAKTLGIYTGATVYEVAGVVAVGNALSQDVASAALLTKLVRVLLLAPFLILVSHLSRSGDSNSVSSANKAQTPWFAFYFFGVCLLSSALPVPELVRTAASSVSSWSTALAMVALGLESDVEAIRRMGWRPMLLAIFLFAYLVIGGLFSVQAVLRLLPA